MGEGIGEDHSGQARAEEEGIISDGGDAPRDHDGFDARTNREGLIADGRHGIPLGADRGNHHDGIPASTHAADVAGTVAVGGEFQSDRGRQTELPAQIANALNKYVVNGRDLADLYETAGKAGTGRRALLTAGGGLDLVPPAHLVPQSVHVVAHGGQAANAASGGIALLGTGGGRDYTGVFMLDTGGKVTLIGMPAGTGIGGVAHRAAGSGSYLGLILMLCGRGVIIPIGVSAGAGVGSIALGGAGGLCDRRLVLMPFGDDEIIPIGMPAGAGIGGVAVQGAGGRGDGGLVPVPRGGDVITPIGIPAGAGIGSVAVLRTGGRNDCSRMGMSRSVKLSGVGEKAHGAYAGFLPLFGAGCRFGNRPLPHGVIGKGREFVTVIISADRASIHRVALLCTGGRYNGGGICMPEPVDQLQLKLLTARHGAQLCPHALGGAGRSQHLLPFAEGMNVLGNFYVGIRLVTSCKRA